MRRACCIAFLLASGVVLAAQDKTPMFIEVDHLKGVEKLKPRDFRHWYVGSKFKIRGAIERHKPPAPPQSCVDDSTIHDLLFETKSHRIISPNVWYAHGLVVPYKAMTDPEGYCTIMEGLLFLLDDGSGEIGYREAFVVFDGNFDASQEKERAYTAAHELGHVLNTHHCEYYLDGWGSWGKALGTHTKLHLDRRFVDERHVRPGGELWCTESEYHRDSHHTASHCAAEVECCDYACGFLSTLSTGSDGQGAVLSVEAGKQRYFPGEPMHVDLELVADGSAGDLYYVRNSLSTLSGLLFFSVGDSPDTMQALPMPMLAKQPRELVPLLRGDRLEKPRVGFWFTLPPEWYGWNEGRDIEKSLWLAVTYVLFTPDEENSREYREVLIQSDPIEITIGLDDEQPRLWDSAAHELFIDWQARRFVWLGGSHVLPEGRRKLELITELYPGTIYAFYADKALEQSCGLPPPLRRDKRREVEKRCRSGTSP